MTMSDIRAYVMQHELFNHHDHQQGYTEIEQGRDGYDFTSLFGYADADLACAAGTDVDVKAISRQELATLWQAIRLTGYGRAVDLGSRALFGIPFAPDRWDEITAALQARLAGKSSAEIYADMLAAAQIKWTINDCYWLPLESWSAAMPSFPSSYRATWRMDELFSAVDMTPFKALARATGRNVYSVSGAVQALNEAIGLMQATGRLAAIKIGMAYQRDLTITDPTLHEAELAFNGLRNPVVGGTSLQQRSGAVDARTARPLGDYLLQRLFERASDDNIPVQIHTGYLAGSWGALEATRAMRLLPVLDKYRSVRFDLFHASWPWCAELGAIAKEFPNVWPDLCWMWAMNPGEAERALDGWLDAMPFTKIFGFGSDTGLPWCVVGYALQAKIGIANVLERRVRGGLYSEADAREVADHLLLLNGQIFFGLGD